MQANLASIGWWFVGLTALYLLAEIAFVLGWRAVMDPRPPLSSVPALLRIYLAGNTLNYLSPGSVAGEPVRASMLRERLGTSSAIASVASVQLSAITTIRSPAQSDGRSPSSMA